MSCVNYREKHFPADADVEVFQGLILSRTYTFPVCINDLMILSVIWLSMSVILLSTVGVIRHLICYGNIRDDC